MLSAFLASEIPSDGFFGLGTSFSTYEIGGFTPWEYNQENENPFVFSPQEPVFSFSGSDNSNNPITVGSNSDNPNGTGLKSGSDEQNREVSPIDERKRRRMISNRESARRSRVRKEKHLENLRNQLNQLKIGNRELMNRVRLVSHDGQLLRRENDKLRSESAMLQQKLWDIRQVLLVRQLQQQLLSSAWPCNNNVGLTTSVNEQNPTSLIT